MMLAVAALTSAHDDASGFLTGIGSPPGRWWTRGPDGGGPTVGVTIDGGTPFLRPERRRQLADGEGEACRTLAPSR